MKHAFKRIMALALVIAMMIGVLPSVFSANVAGFTDVKDDAWYAKYVEYVVFQDLMIGTSTNTFEPESPLTRAMTATVLWRMAGEPPFYNKSTFTDLTEDWYMNAVAWAQSKKIVNGVTTTTFEPDTFATREQIVAMLWRYAGSPKAESDYLKDYTDAASISSYAKDAFNWAISVGIINGWHHKLTPRDNATRAEFAKMIYQYAEITKPCTHTWDGGKVTKEATCTEAGEMLYTCTKCGETKIAPIPAKGHHYGDDGKCTDCGAEKPVDPTEPTTPTEPDESTVVENVVIYYPKESKVMTTEEYSYTSPKTGKTKLELASAGATLADGKVTTSATNAAVFTMTTTKDGIVTFKTKDGKFLYVDGTDVKLVAEEGECTKFVLEDTEGGKFIRCATKEYNGNPQYLEFYGGYFTTFGMGTDPSIYVFNIYPIATGETPEPPTPSTDEYVLTNELKDGDEVVIYNPGNGKALAGEMSRYYVAGADVTPENDKITGPEAKLVWTVKKNADGSYTFTQDGGKTLGVSSRESDGKTYYNLYIDGEHDATWTVEALNAENKLFKIYSATMTGSYGNVYVEWYAKNTAFSAYDAGADKVTEKDFGFQFYVKGGKTPEPCEHVWNDGVITTEPTCTEAGVKTYTCTGCGETKTEAVPALGHDYVNGVCSRCGATEPVLPEYVLATELKDGDEVVVYNPGNGKAIAGEMSSYYVAGVAVTPDDNKLTDPAAKLIWTVKKNADGSYTFTQDGDKIFGTSPRENNGQTYYNLYIDGEHDTTWTIEALNAESKLFKIYSATLTGSHGNVYVEWYAKKTAFSAYDAGADKVTEKDFGFQFYVKKTAEEPAKDITVCFTNDVHGAYELYPYAATAMKGADLIVDAGDNIQGSVATTLTNGQCMVDLMKAVGYDVAVPGNHEFDYGFDRFLEIVKGAGNTPYVSANLWDKTADKAVLDAYKMFTVNGKKVAVVGITTPETLVKSTPTFFQNEAGEYIYDFCNDTTGEKLYKVVQKAVDAAKAAGADYVIAVGHLGIDEQSEPWTSTSVIKNTTGIDALIDGHSHSTFSNTVKNKDGKDIVVAQTGTKLANVGKLTIAADGKITAVNIPLYEVKTRVNPDTGKEEKYNDYLFEEDEKIAAEVAKVKAEIDKVSNTVVAKTEVDLTTLDPVTGKRAVRNAETNLGDLCADAYRDLLKTDIAFVNGGGVRDNIKKGDITYGQIIAVHPFGNTACKIEVTGEQIWTALEIGAAANPGESGGFLQVSGLEYTINTYIPTPARFDENKNFVKLEGEHRVTDVKIGGQPLDVNKTYTLGGHNYMLIDGGDGFTVFKGSKILAQEVAIDNEVLIKYITGTLNGVVAADSIYANPTGEGRIHIKIAPVEVSSTHRDGVKIPTYVTFPEDYGTRDAYPMVVMLHGHGGNHNEWGGYDAISNGLAAKGAVVVTLDFPGCGASTEAFERNTLTNMKHDVLDVIGYMAEHYQIDNTRIGGFGYSMGGRILLEMLAEETGSFAAIELVAPGEDAADLKQMFVRTSDTAVTWDEMKAEAEKNGYYDFTGGYWKGQHLSKEWFADYEKYPDGLVEAAAAKYAGTSLVIWATDDTTIAPSVSANTAAVLNSATVNTYKEGHSYSFYGKDAYTVSTVNNASIGYFVNELITRPEGVTGYVQSIAKYGNLELTIPGAELTEAGYEYGDILKITVDGKEFLVPYGSNYSDVDQGNAVLRNSDNHLTLALNNANFATKNGFATKTTNTDKTYEWYYTAGVGLPLTVKIEMGEKGGYYDEWINHQLKRTNDRDDYKNLSDAEFANFRQITTTGMGDHLYRGSSPINPEIGRNTYADAALKNAKATVIMNLADDEATAKAYEGFASTYYAGQKVIYLNLGVDFTAKDFQDGLADGLKFFVANEGVYYVHCTEGKDRCGFVSALLECLMGATADEVVADYMVTYYNYYGVDKTTDAKKYESIANSNIIKTLKTAFEVDDLTTADLAAEAEAYIKSIGLTDAEITNLKANLANKTEGHTHTYCAPEDATYTWDELHTTCTATTLCTDENCPDLEKGKITETCSDVTKKVIFRWNCLEEELSDVTATFKDTEHFLSTVTLKNAVTKKATATEHSWDENDECTVCHIFKGNDSKQLALLHPASGMLLLDQTYPYADGKKTGLQGAEYEVAENGTVNTLEKECFKFRISCSSHYTQPYELVIARGTFYCDGENLTVKELADIDESLRQNIYFDIETNEDGTKYISFTNVTNKDGKKVYLMWDGEAFTVAPMDENNKAAYTFKLAVGGHAHKKVLKDTTPATCTTDGVMTYECESKISGCTKTWQETIPATGHDVNTATGNCKTCGKTVYALAEGVRAGDEVIIYHVASGKAMSTEEFASVDVTPVKDTVTTDAAIVWKVEKDVNGLKFVNKATGETLATDSSRALKYADTNNYWTLNWSRDFKSRIIVNTTAKGGQGDPQAIEWYNGSFTTYYWNTSSTDTESLFAVQFYVKDIQAAEHEHVYSDVTTRWESDYSAFYFESHCTVPGCGIGSNTKISGEGITKTVLEEAKCTTEGKVQYSVTYNANGTTHTATSPEVTIPAKGHTYENGVCKDCGEPEPLTPPVSSTRYEKVTTTPTDADSKTDWTGTYLIVYEASDTEAYMFNGETGASNYKTEKIADGVIAVSDTTKACEMTVAKCDTGWSFRMNAGTNAGKYLSSGSKLNMISSAQAFSIDISSETANISDGSKKLMFNAASGQTRFRFYAGGQKDITLYKLVTTK